MLNTIKSIISALIIGIIFYFIGKTFLQNLSELDNFDFKINWLYFCVSVSLFWLLMVMNSWIYHKIIQKVANEIPYHRNLQVWSQSYLGRYIPGKVSILAIRINLYKKENLDYKNITYIFFIETLLSMVSSITIFMIYYMFSKNHINTSQTTLVYLILIVVLTLVLIHPTVLMKIFSAIKKIFNFKNQQVISFIDYSFLIKLLFVNFLKWSISGMGIYFLIGSIYSDIGLSNLLDIIGGYAIASVSGLLSFFAPSGLGVVEGIIILFYKSFLPITIATIVSIMIRTWKIIGELSFIGFVFIFNKMKR